MDEPRPTPSDDPPPVAGDPETAEPDPAPPAADEMSASGTGMVHALPPHQEEPPGSEGAPAAEIEPALVEASAPEQPAVPEAEVTPEQPTVPEPETSAAPESAPEQSAVPEAEVAPEQPAVPEPAQDQPSTPEPETGAEPEAAAGAVPEPETSAAPESVPEQRAEPEAAAGAVPEPETGAVLEAAAGAASASVLPKAESERHARLARENADRLEKEVEALRTGHIEHGQRQFRSFFEHERRIHQLFRQLKPLHSADRHRIWEVFKDAGTQARQAQQEEWDSRRYQSIEAREVIEEKLRRAQALVTDAAGSADHRRADGLLNEVRNLLTGSGQNAPGSMLIGPDRRACWDEWRKARDDLRKRRGGLQEHDYQALAAPVAEAVAAAKTGDPFQVVRTIKDLQARLGKAYLRRGQFEELRRRLSEAWLVAQERLAGERQERTERRREWRDRMQGHLGRWRETIGHKQSQREHLLGQVEKLEGMKKNSRSEDFAVQVDGWLQETHEKLRRVDEFIAELEQRIRDTGKRIGAPRERVGRGSRGPGRSGGPGAAPGSASGPPSGEGQPRRRSGERRRGTVEPRGGTDAPRGGPGEASGGSGEASRDPGEASGDSGEASRDSGEASGDPGEASGDPGEASGDSGEASGGNEPDEI